MAEGGFASFATLLHAFGGKNIKNQLKRQLDHLVGNNELFKQRGNRYALAEQKPEVVSGRLSLHQDGYGFVSQGKDKPDIYIAQKGMAGALNGDLVTVELSPVIKGQGKREGRITAVTERANSRIVGIFRQTPANALLIPEDTRLGTTFFIPPAGINGAVDGQQVILEVTLWPDKNRLAAGKVVEILGWPDDPDVEMLTVIHRFQLPHVFDAATLAEAEVLPATINSKELCKRTDLRDLPTVTIDGETAKDFDDAVSLQQDGSNFRLFVSIADVSHYVTPDSHIDREAYLRGTSVYFPKRSIPMLPERLSNNICSLNPGQERLTMTAELLLDNQGRLLAADFYTSVIKSDARLTYTQVKALIEDGDATPLGEARWLAPMLLEMKKLALVLMEMRRKRGSIDFDLPEPEITFDLTGKTEAIVKSERNLAHRLIEEFMLAANEAVAGFVTSKKHPFIYRIHEQPDQEKLNAFQDFLLPFGFRLTYVEGKIKPQSLQQLVAAASGTPEERMVNYGLLRCMKQARYSEENFGHFGLASDCYTHFTSPIRRYPDLLVHRFLKLVLLAKEQPLPKKDQKLLEELTANLPEAAEHCSNRERVAMEAERDIVELKKLQFMQDKIGEEFAGFVAGVTAFGCFVELTEFFVEGLVHISTINDDFYSFEERLYALKGRRSNKIIRIGDPVTVRVVAVNPQARRIEFVLTAHASAQRPDNTHTFAQNGEQYLHLPVKGKRPKLKQSVTAKPVHKKGRKPGKRGH